jgi:hypothetical protein
MDSPEIDSKESIPPAYVAGGPVREPYSYLVPGPHRLLKNSSTELIFLGKVYNCDGIKECRNNPQKKHWKETTLMVDLAPPPPLSWQLAWID